MKAQTASQNSGSARLAFQCYAAVGDWQESSADRMMFWIYGVAGLVFCFSFLLGGAHGTPRRFAEHGSEWLTYGQVGAVSAILVVVAALHLGGKLLRRLPHASL